MKPLIAILPMHDNVRAQKEGMETHQWLGDNVFLTNIMVMSAKTIIYATCDRKYFMGPKYLYPRSLFHGNMHAREWSKKSLWEGQRNTWGFPPKYRI